MYRITPDMADVPGYFEEGWTANDAIAHIRTWPAGGAQLPRPLAPGTQRAGGTGHAP